MISLDVLVIDDDDDARYIVRQYVHRLQRSCQDVASAAAAHAFLSQACLVTLILVDLHLPQEDGYQLLQAIRATPTVAAAHVVAFTASVLPTDIAAAQQAGFDGFLSKPLHPTTAPDQLRHLLDRQPLWPTTEDRGTGFSNRQSPEWHTAGLAAQRRQYVQELGPMLAWMAEQWATAAASSHPMLWIAVLQPQIHKHTGTAVAVGLTDLAERLRALDQIFRTIMHAESVTDREIQHIHEQFRLLQEWASFH